MMTIADRIQALRKARGYSQEELADRLGVSRQAVSKWESEQALPDLERVTLMSEVFEVTTDYLLKGIEPAQNAKRGGAARAEIFVVVATAMIYIGLVLSCAIWYEAQTAGALLAGAVFMALGLMLWGVGRYTADPASLAGARRLFWRINIWALSFLPLSAMHGLLTWGVPTAYPVSIWPVWAFGAFFAVWLGVCAAVFCAVARPNARR